MHRVLIVFQRAKHTGGYINTMAPVGLLSVASYLESRGIATDVVDCHVEHLHADYRKYTAILFAINISNIEHSIETAEQAKAENPSAQIIAGGPLSLRQAEHVLLGSCMDAVILGEGEAAAYEYLTSPNKKEVSGLLFKDSKGALVYTGERRVLLQLDTLPFPALQKVPLRRYNIAIKKKRFVSNIVTSRGCPHSCIFCYHSKVWRQRSPAHVLQEIEWQVNKLGVEELAVMDDSIASNPSRVWEICQGIIDRKIDVTWQLKNGVRVDDIDKDMLTIMRDSGLWLLRLAPEVGSQESLDKIQKGFTLDRVTQVVDWCKELGIKTFAFYTMGYPWETKEDLQETLDFSKNLKTDFLQVCRVVPIEGTPLYDTMGIRPSEEFKETGTHYGGMKHAHHLLDAGQIHAFIRRTYRSHYLKPNVLLRLMKTLYFQDFLRLARYSVTSNSM